MYVNKSSCVLFYSFKFLSLCFLLSISVPLLVCLLISMKSARFFSHFLTSLVKRSSFFSDCNTSSLRAQFTERL